MPLVKIIRQSLFEGTSKEEQGLQYYNGILQYSREIRLNIEYEKEKWECVAKE